VRAVLVSEPALAAELVDPEPEPLLAPLVTPPLAAREGEGLDLILEGFLLHHGQPRHIRPAARGRRVLAGDYCYAQGLVRVASAGDLFAIEALADLIALSAGLVARGRRDALAPLWLATAAAIAGRRKEDDARALHLAAAKIALRDEDDPEPLRALAAVLPPAPGLATVFAAPEEEP